jgi:hypothetical protein
MTVRGAVLRATSALFVLLVLGALLGPGAARADVVTTTMPIPLDFLTENPCNHEPVLLTGEVRVTINANASESGGTHVYTTFSYQDNTAINPVTGAKYQFNAIEHPFEFNDPSPPTFVFWAENSQELVSLSPNTPNFITHLKVQFTINANYVPTANAVQVTVDCVGGPALF